MSNTILYLLMADFLNGLPYHCWVCHPAPVHQLVHPGTLEVLFYNAERALDGVPVRTVWHVQHFFNVQLIHLFLSRYSFMNL